MCRNLKSKRKKDETINKKANNLTMFQQNEGSFENIKKDVITLGSKPKSDAEIM